ncbi:TonB-linked outer membrane protein, SusC/RagA family [Dysgonomonas macrotermitis]|uniref:TonB-linked outer membrane protein, SusC/RagA family n=2 Tax=Dysgonomonas macrotermitis TaxID=1346286 RepID=A0A1M4T4F2_9BACT|nr:TonB-linked outer membrane protein, SusC/RagA family [Dysgonomonas macrotermitis]
MYIEIYTKSYKKTQLYYMENKEIKLKTVRLRAIPVMGYTALCLLLFAPLSGHASKGLPTGAETTEAQQTGSTVKGTVKDATGEPLIGVSVTVKGTTNGALTDIDGNYTLKVSEPNAVLVFSYIGFKAQELTIGGRSDISVTLQEDLGILDEVVVVGYGVQKKKLITGATVQVSGDNLTKLSTTSAFTALQSQTPGVNIQASSGQPGEGFKVYIRGLGTANSYAPLYVIDGVAGGDINNLNPSDIESIDVLKDAASAAIYGARAANGVILVTTKQGKSGKIQVSYDGYFGVQNVYKTASLLNAQQYMQVMDEINFNENQALNNWQAILGDNYESVMNGTWKGTNWLNEMRNKNAPIQNHAVNLTGGSEFSKFSMGVSYTSQEGIYGYPVQSEYERTTARLNSEHVLWKAGDRDVIKIGENLNYSYTVRNGIGIGNQYWNDISNALRGMPIMPVYGSSGEYFDYDDIKSSGLSQYESQMSNPIADMVYNRGYNTTKNHNLNMTGYLVVEPIKNLIFKTQFGYKMSANNYRAYTPEYTLSSSSNNQVSSVDQHGGMGWSFTWDNTVNYKFELNKAHHFDVLVGQSIEKSGMGDDFGGTGGNLNFNGYKYAYLSNTQGLIAGASSVTGEPWDEGRLASFFGRINYDWNETYMATLIMRADGSSNFARGKRWGYFPSVSAGWVTTNEKFMESSRSWLDFLKVRASWGQNGNCNIPNFMYLATISFENADYSFGNNKESQTTGGFSKILPNPDVTWETSEQLNLGIDARFLDSRLGLAFDWYSKKTKDWLLQAPIIGAIGTGAPYINGGEVENKGLEIGLNWNDHIGSDFTYGANLNMAFNKNKVLKINNSEGIIHGESNLLAQNTPEINRVQEGYAMGYFYGYKTAGIFQNQAEIDAWKAAGNGIIQTNVQPGDVKFVDLNKDGVINEDDKTQIGDPNPDFTMGFSFNIGYKGFDLSVTTYGAFGQQVARSYRKFSDGRHENYTTEILESWRGEGTSNRLPRLTSGSNANYINISDLYIEDADYLKLQNLTIGYDFKKLFPKMPLGQARLYFTAQNLFTITGYSGMDPEVGYGGDDTVYSWSRGIDVGYYPNPRTYLIGVNLKF